MSQNAAFDDANIPVLTEVVQDKGAPTPAATAATQLEPAASTPAEPDWNALERRIAEQVSAELQKSIEAIVARAVAQAVEQLRTS
jgi:hypothetical protein